MSARFTPNVQCSFLSALAIFACGITIFGRSQASAGDLVRGQSISRAVYELEFTVQLLNGGDKGVVGVGLIVHNVSTTRPLELSRISGEIPIAVNIFKERDAIPFPDGSGISMRAVNPRNRVKIPEPSSPAQVRWAIAPGKKEHYFLPTRELFETVPEKPLTECLLSVRPLIWPPKEYFKRRSPRRGLDQDSDALTIHPPFLKDVKFRNVTLTKEGLAMDARKLYESLLEGEK